MSPKRKLREACGVVRAGLSWLLTAAALASVACAEDSDSNAAEVGAAAGDDGAGSTDDGSPSPNAEPAPGADPDGPVDSTARVEAEGCADPAPGPAPMRRLTNAEYQNTLTDLVGDAELVKRVTSAFPQEPTSLGFRRSAQALTINPLIAELYLQAAQALAPAAIARDGVVPCEVDSADAACVQSFVEEFGRHVYRRPLTRQELERASTLYDTVVTETGDRRTALEWLATAMFSSSHFLFRVELSRAPDDGVSRPSGYEMASRLSYLLWQTMPDQALFDAAEAGDLTSRDGIQTQVLRMMNDAKALRVYEFFEQWLDLDEAEAMTRSQATYPDYDDDLRELLKAENRAFVYDLLTTNGTFADMLAGEYTFANRALAQHYGLDETPEGTAFERVAAPGRAGVLTQATLLMHDPPARTSIVKRGLKIRTDFLCQIVPAPPDDVDTSLPELDGNLTQRDRLEQHRADPSCAGCHMLMDPIGEIFEPFDALGRERSEDEGGAEVVRGGSIAGTRTLDGAYADARGLALAMSESDEVRSCFALQAFRFFYGRDATPADACTQAQLMDTFARNDYRLVDLLIGLTRSDQFLYRPAFEGADQ